MGIWLAVPQYQTQLKNAATYQTSVMDVFSFGCPDSVLDNFSSGIEHLGGIRLPEQQNLPALPSYCAETTNSSPRPTQFCSSRSHFGTAKHIQILAAFSPRRPVVFGQKCNIIHVFLVGSILSEGKESRTTSIS